MTLTTTLGELLGQWRGENRLWLDPDNPPALSETTALVESIAQDKFVTLRYTWADDGNPQDGLLLLGAESDDGSVQAVWVDSWHMDRVQMQFWGAVGPDGVVSVAGSYAAPPGPDWGWRIVIEPRQGDSFRLLMYNVTPEEEEQLAVEAVYHPV
ncbi:MAG: DUF1579 family protein [Caldilineaceae bacterium]|nr:DUF1579 family protein [Caldilineaceae bacterium]